MFAILQYFKMSQDQIYGLLSKIENYAFISGESSLEKLVV